MPLLAACRSGYHVVAFDQRGYGRTTGWDTSAYANVDMKQFSMTQLTTDALALVYALGHAEVACVVGHDFGAQAAAMCALMRPDVFRSVVLMSHPFKGVPEMPFGTGEAKKEVDLTVALEELGRLEEPRKHYKWYNSTSTAAKDWETPDQGLERFLRGYLHLKSADWKGNKPHKLKEWSATELAKMPHYYIIPKALTFPQAVAANMQTEDENVTKRWMSDDDLAFYVQEWRRTGFQGGLNWYRAGTEKGSGSDMLLFAGKKIEVPCSFVTGEKDWGNYQQPGAIEAMIDGKSCADFRGVNFVKDAGHWPQQEKPEDVANEIIRFLGEL